MASSQSPLFKNLTQDEVDTYSLILSSSDIQYNLMGGEHGWDIYVDDAFCEKALNVIGKYLAENQDPHPIPETGSFEYGKTFSGAWVSLALLIVYAAIAVYHDNQTIIKIYGSDAQRILDGELYRSVSSLMLHGDALHLAGNMLGIALFGTAVCYITGPGVGWLMILAVGISGNLINAYLYQRYHLSIGASTAVFGALGILAGYQALKKFRAHGERARAWLPLGGGLALLALLGSGKHTDLTAHLFGFLAGITGGLLYGLLVKHPPRKLYQACCLIVALGLIAISLASGYNAELLKSLL